MVFLRKERFRVCTYHKLRSKKLGPCKILRKFGENAYKVALPQGLNISPTCSVSDLYAFHGDLPRESYDAGEEAEGRAPCKEVNAVERVIQVKILAYRFLVHWIGKPDCENSCLNEDEFIKIDVDKYQAAKMATCSEMSSL